VLKFKCCGLNTDQSTRNARLKANEIKREHPEPIRQGGARTIFTLTGIPDTRTMALYTDENLYNVQAS
jgi:hypothetical protein